MTFQLTGRETALIPSVLVVLIRAAALHAITFVIIKTVHKNAPPSPRNVRTSLCIRSGAHVKWHASFELAAHADLLVCQTQNLHHLVIPVGNTGKERRSGSPQEAWSLIHESVCWNGSAQTTRRAGKQQADYRWSKQIFNQLKKKRKKRQEDKTWCWATAQDPFLLLWRWEIKL